MIFDVMRPPGCWVTGLENLIKECAPRGATILEIGAFAGESTVIFLKSKKIKTVYSIDAWQNGLDMTDLTTTQFNLGEVEQEFDRKTMPYAAKLVKVKANSLECVDQFPDKFFNLIYHDACHEYAHLSKELELYKNKVKDGGVVAGHDYAAAYPGVTQAVNERFGSPDKTYEDFSWVKFV